MTRILLVEDNEMNRDMLSRRLVNHGYEILIAVDGARGVEMAMRARPDLILMDMSLPVLDWVGSRAASQGGSRDLPYPDNRLERACHGG